MNLETFKTELRKAKASKPKVFQNPYTDPPAEPELIQTLESDIKVELEQTYKEFVKEFGSGDFGFGVIYSPNPKSDWYMKTKLKSHLPKDFLPISENFCGDSYGFKTIDGKCVGPIVIFDHETNSVKETEYQNVFDLMTQTALGNP
jgi:hypothetical protein